MLYNVQPGDSPTLIARTFGVSLDALIRANPQKPTKIVTGPDGVPRTTWQSLTPRETVIVPVAGMVGDATSDAINALIAAGGPCLQANAGLVCAVQRALGVTVDGKYGSGTAAAARARVANAPAGCSPSPSWWTPKGQSNCPAVVSTPVALNWRDWYNSQSITVQNQFDAARAAIQSGGAIPTAVVGTPMGQALAAWQAETGAGQPPATPAPPTPSGVSAAVQALVGIDPCDPANVAIVCAAQRALGLSPDGKYGSGTSTAASRLVRAPAPCSPRPSWWTPKGVSNCPGGAPPTPPPPTPGRVVPAAVQALLSIDPCAASSAATVCAAQRALGLSPDGKYGSDTATAARRFLPSAPPGCSPRPSWWTPKGQSNCPGGAPSPAPSAATQATQAAQAATQAAQTAQQAATQASQAPPAQQAAAQAAAARASQVATQAAQVATQAATQAAQTAPTQAAAAQAAATQAAQAAQAAQTASGGATPTGGQITPPEEKKGVSTGAIVAGAVGAAALVGLVAMSAGKKPARRRAGQPAARKPSKRKSSRKPARRRK